MNRGVLGLGIGLLFFGLGTALFFFRKPSEETDSTASEIATDYPVDAVLRQPVKDENIDGGGAAVVNAGIAPLPQGLHDDSGAQPPATVELNVTPPPLVENYPAQIPNQYERPWSTPGASQPWGSSGANEPSRPMIEPRRTHLIIDGDTLPKLAKRFLGSEEFADAIYELNRDVLIDRDLLPIGKLLKLPAKEELTNLDRPARTNDIKSALVPVPQRAAPSVPYGSSLALPASEEKLVKEIRESPPIAPQGKTTGWRRSNRR